MNPWRFLLVALCAIALTATANAASPDTPAAASYCNKLCIIGYHCVPTPTGGRCVPGHAAAETDLAAADATDRTPLTWDQNAANVTSTEVEASPAANRTPLTCDQNAANVNLTEVEASTRPECGPCTILCPIGTHLVQTGNCDCKCVGNAG